VNGDHRTGVDLVGIVYATPDLQILAALHAICGQRVGRGWGYREGEDLPSKQVTQFSVAEQTPSGHSVYRGVSTSFLFRVLLSLPIAVPVAVVAAVVAGIAEVAAVVAATPVVAAVVLATPVVATVVVVTPAVVVVAAVVVVTPVVAALVVVTPVVVVIGAVKFPIEYRVKLSLQKSVRKVCLPVKAKLLNPPATAVIMRVFGREATNRGSGESVLVPSPSWPQVFDPIAYSSNSVVQKKREKAAGANNNNNNKQQQQQKVLYPSRISCADSRKKFQAPIFQQTQRRAKAGLRPFPTAPHHPTLIYIYWEGKFFRTDTPKRQTRGNSSSLYCSLTPRVERSVIGQGSGLVCPCGDLDYPDACQGRHQGGRKLCTPPRQFLCCSFGG